MGQHRFNPRVLEGGNGHGNPNDLLNNPNIPIIGKKLTPMPCPFCGSIHFLMLPTLVTEWEREGKEGLRMNFAPSGQQVLRCAVCFKDPTMPMKQAIAEENSKAKVDHADNGTGGVPGGGEAQS